VQDDAEIKYAQIQNMVHVYAKAYITLVDGKEQPLRTVGNSAPVPNTLAATLDGVSY
jgi:hypothetical protein